MKNEYDVIYLSKANLPVDVPVALVSHNLSDVHVRTSVVFECEFDLGLG